MKFNTGKLKVTLPSDCEILVTREFAAPRQLVFDAHTKPEMVKQWLFGPAGWSMSICEIDLRVGGKYRYVWRNESEGQEFGTAGVFMEIGAPGKIVSTERFEGALDQGEAVNTMLLTEKAGKTVLTLLMRYPSKEVREGALQSGMNEGIEMSFARLEQQLAAAGKAGGGKLP
jgi:uncharacterized protein YndB with AHSA1/START domain